MCILVYLTSLYIYSSSHSSIYLSIHPPRSIDLCMYMYIYIILYIHPTTIIYLYYLHIYGHRSTYIYTYIYIYAYPYMNIISTEHTSLSSCFSLYLSI